MIRVDRAQLTRNEIIRLAANRFLKDGYSKTSIHAMCKILNMSTGNMTFHFPTKEHLLAELTDILCKFQWKAIEYETKRGYSLLEAFCFEFLTMAAACEEDAVAKDFFISAYCSPMSLDMIRKNDKDRAQKIFREYCPDWKDEHFIEAETLVSGIEYATFMTTSESAPLETRIAGALQTILAIYQVPEEIRKENIQKVLKMDYRKFGLRVLEEFRTYVDEATEQALTDLFTKKEVAPK